jgi:hypothetical protein
MRRPGHLRENINVIYYIIMQVNKRLSAVSQIRLTQKLVRLNFIIAQMYGVRTQLESMHFSIAIFWNHQ